MASTYSQDNVEAGVDSIVSSPVNYLLVMRYSAVSQTVGQSVSQSVSR